jgi:hypothetical protein
MTRHHIGGWAALTGAASSMLFATAFYLFIHGSTGRDRNGSFLGFEGLAVGRVGVVTGAALLLLVWGVYPLVRARTGPRRGAVAAGVGAAAFLFGRVMQTWLANPQDPEDFAGVRVTLGFYLESVGSIIFGVGFVVVAATAGGLLTRLARVGCLLIGAGSWMPLLSPVLIPDHPQASLGWDVTATLLGLPQCIGLVLVGVALLRAVPGTIHGDGGGRGRVARRTA